MRYLILQHPGHNRVYYQQAEKLALAELKIAVTKFSQICLDVKSIEIAYIRYLTFTVEHKLSDVDIRKLSELSFAFALFCCKDEGNNIHTLIPVQKQNKKYIDSKIGTVLKYQGKTNELFTRMMINVALLSGDFNEREKITLLDPVAGKGTTLFEGTVLGFDVYGVEIDSNAVREIKAYFKKFLEKERIKYKFEQKRISGKSKKDAIFIEDFEYATSKDDFKKIEKRKKLGIISGTTEDVNRYFKKPKFDVIVGDLPYGIAHSNTNQKKMNNQSRSPEKLLTDALPAWKNVLKSEGIVVVAWNVFVASRKSLIDVFHKSGFRVFNNNSYHEFEHRVDNAIKRDIIVAQKK